MWVAIFFALPLGGRAGAAGASASSSSPDGAIEFGVAAAAAKARRRGEAAAAVLEAGRLEASERQASRGIDQQRPEAHEARLGREACTKRFRMTDFAAGGFSSAWMTSENMTAFSRCLYRLRTTWRPASKNVLVGGVHYPTLLTTHHVFPPVSSASAQWCWLDGMGIGPSGMTAASCCDTSQGPRGQELCWDDHFTYELCCRGDIGNKEIPHFFVAPAFDINVGSAVRQIGTFDLSQSYALQALCRPGDLVLDIGANVGGFTVPLAERVGPQGEVHAFEPFRKVFQHLNANIALNGLTNVFAHNVALGSSRKTVHVHTPDLTTWNLPSAMRVEGQYSPEKALHDENLRYEWRRERLEVRPLDTFEFDRPVRLVKIDVEFMELEVVRGARETLRRDRPVVWVENEPFFGDPPDRALVDFMRENLDYECRPVARLELLCAHGSYGEGKGRLPSGFGGVFGLLASRDLRLGDVLREVDPPPVQASNPIA
mmetsp:Transcript_99695/g.281465  ORF Transcript_99695/g.281465 Transcript_99695/m.281465 type:complete len:486 (-) Transcript_99695:17-1474(-)